MKNMESLMEKLSAQMKNLPKAAKRSAEESARKTCKRAKHNAPVRTGRLKKSIKAKGGRVYTFCPYALFVELGTRFMAPRFFMTRAVMRGEYGKTAFLRGKEVFK